MSYITELLQKVFDFWSIIGYNGQRNTTEGNYVNLNLIA